MHSGGSLSPPVACAADRSKALFRCSFFYSIHVKDRFQGLLRLLLLWFVLNSLLYLLVTVLRLI